MTAIVAPPGALIPPAFPPLGASNFNQMAYDWGTAEPAVAQRMADLAQATHQNAVATHERAVSADESANDAEWHADRVALLNSLFLGAAGSDPATGKGGAALVAGNFYVNPTVGHLRVYDGTAWRQSVAGMAGVASLNSKTGALELSTLQDYGITDAARVETDVNVITSDTTAVAGRSYDCDTRSGSFTLTLPLAPGVGARVGVRDAQRTFHLYPLTVLRNGQRIEGTEDDLLINGFARGFLEFRGPALGWLFISL